MAGIHGRFQPFATAPRNETGDQTDQESRSAGLRAAAIVTSMDITLHASYLCTVRAAIRWAS